MSKLHCKSSVKLLFVWSHQIELLILALECGVLSNHSFTLHYLNLVFVHPMCYFRGIRTALNLRCAISIQHYYEMYLSNPIRQSYKYEHLKTSAVRMRTQNTRVVVSIFVILEVDSLTGRLYFSSTSSRLNNHPNCHIHIAPELNKPASEPITKNSWT